MALPATSAAAVVLRNLPLGVKVLAISQAFSYLREHVPSSKDPPVIEIVSGFIRSAMFLSYTD